MSEKTMEKHMPNFEPFTGELSDSIVEIEQVSELKEELSKEIRTLTNIDSNTPQYTSKAMLVHLKIQKLEALDLADYLTSIFVCDKHMHAIKHDLYKKKSVHKFYIWLAKAMVIMLMSIVLVISFVFSIAEFSGTDKTTKDSMSDAASILNRIME